MSGLWDVHNHILPGIDDGASCLDESMDMIALEYEQGVRNIVFTPHLRKGMFEIGDTDRIKAFEKVTDIYHKVYEQELPGMKFYMGCELHVHPGQGKKAENPLYRMPGDRIVLTEFATPDNYETVDRILSPLLQEGYRCIVAHAERYSLGIDGLRELAKREGVFIQINAGSVIGDEGFRQKMLVKKMLKEQLVDLIGSDAHNISWRKVNIGACADRLAGKYGKAYMERIMRENPEKLFQV